VSKLLQFLIGAHERIGSLENPLFQGGVQFANLRFRFLAFANIPDGAGYDDALLGLQGAEADLDRKRLTAFPEGMQLDTSLESKERNFCSAFCSTSACLRKASACAFSLALLRLSSENTATLERSTSGTMGLNRKSTAPRS